MSNNTNLKNLIVGYNLSKAMTNLLKQKPVTAGNILSMLKSYSSCVTVSRSVLLSLPDEMTGNHPYGLEETMEFDKLAEMSTEGLSNGTDEEEIMPSGLVKKFEEYVTNLKKTLAVAIACLTQVDTLLLEGLKDNELNIVEECRAINEECYKEMQKRVSVRQAEREAEETGDEDLTKRALISSIAGDEDEDDLEVGVAPTGIKTISEDFNVRD